MLINHDDQYSEVAKPRSKLNWLLKS